LKDYGLDDYFLELSTRDPNKFVGSDELWENATRTLSEVAQESGLELVLDEGGAAFYGPKISVQIRDALKRTWQLSTIQLDFNLPELFHLEFQNSQGTVEQPVMIHRALFGSIERFFGILVEHYAGAFPAWLAPVQVLGIPVASEYEDYLRSVLSELEKKGIRVDLDDSAERFPKKIRNSSQSKIPIALIAGQKDFEGKTVSLRFLDGSQENEIDIAGAIDKILDFCSEPR
jgi:threonyl-tRNA synthetase